MVRVFITRQDREDFWIFVPECQHNNEVLGTLSYGLTWDELSEIDQMELRHITVSEVSILFGYGEEPEYNLALKYEKECGQ